MLPMLTREPERTLLLEETAPPIWVLSQHVPRTDVRIEKLTGSGTKLTGTDTVLATDVGESGTLGVGIAGGHTISVRAAGLGVGERSLVRVRRIVKVVD